MTQKLNRRQFTQLTTFTLFGLATKSILLPTTANAGYADALGFLVTGHPVVATAALVEAVIETGYALVSGKQQRDKLKDISIQLSSIANSQDSIIEQLANQRFVMREELLRAFRDNDARDLVAYAERFRIALLDDQPESSLHEIKGPVDGLATKLSTYGLAGVPFYLTAIALQNAIHLVCKSNPDTFQAINDAHHKNLDSMLNGSGPNSVMSFAQSTFNKDIIRPQPVNNDSVSNPSWDALHNYGKKYPLALIDMVYEADSAWKYFPRAQYAIGYSYEGFQDGKPLIKGYCEKITDAVYLMGPNTAGMKQYLGWACKVDKLNRKEIPEPTEMSKLATVFVDANMNAHMASDWQAIPELQLKSSTLGLTAHWGYETKLDDKGNTIVPDEANDIIRKQGSAIATYYANMYDPSMGPNLSKANDVSTFVKLDPACRSICGLLQDGLTATNRIILAYQSSARPSYRAQGSLPANNP